MERITCGCAWTATAGTATAAAAYHSGWGTVDSLLHHEDYTGDGKTLPSFPYSRMNHYVEKILRCYKRYTELYGPMS